jgi:hypothetical protein
MASGPACTRPTRLLRSRSPSRWDACARLGSLDRGAALTLEGATLDAAQLDAETAGAAATRLARLRREAEAHPDVPSSIFGTLAVAAVMANEPAETVARLAQRALDGGPMLLPEAVDRPPFFYHACVALVFAERYPEALSRYDEAIEDARRLGSLSHVLGLSCYRVLAHLRMGNLTEAEADTRARGARDGTAFTRLQRRAYRQSARC